MLDVYLHSAQEVDKRMVRAEKTVWIGREYDAEHEKGKGMCEVVAALDRFMHSVTDPALVQQAQCFMEGQPAGICGSKIELVVTIAAQGDGGAVGSVE
jgi:hypothetical protein